MALNAAEPKPLPRAHAHNDYEHARPLFDAIDRGFCNIEADVYLIDGQLLVAHDRKDVKPGRTLASLYLEPLRQRVRQNRGRVFRNGPGIVLLVDVKSEASATYAALHAELAKFAEMLTTFGPAESTPGAVTVIVSGNRAPKDLLAQPVRYAAIDGRKDDLELNTAATLVPWVSENWNKIFTWDWQGAMPPAESAALKQWVNRAHAQGRKVRFWNTPDRAEAWRILIAAGVDIIGTDDLDGLQQFLLNEGGDSAPGSTK
jgi:glycerophosphoryl diester phosphodiesterase